MLDLRGLTIIVISLAVAIAPVGVVVSAAHTAVPSAFNLVERHDASVEIAGTDMSDCAGMAQKADCACCDAETTCPPELCATKCLKIFGAVVIAKSIEDRLGSLDYSLEPRGPPGRSPALILPPPRT